MCKFVDIKMKTSLDAFCALLSVSLGSVTLCLCILDPSCDFSCLLCSLYRPTAPHPLILLGGMKCVFLQIRGWFSVL